VAPLSLDQCIRDSLPLNGKFTFDRPGTFRIGTIISRINIYEGLRGKTIIVNIPKMFSIAILKFQKCIVVIQFILNALN